MTRDGERLLTHNKIQHMQNAFSLLDQNKDGKIDLKDLDVLSHIFKYVDKEKVDEALRSADLDEDDKLDIFEFQSLIAKTFETEAQRKREVSALVSSLEGVDNTNDELSLETLVTILCKIDKELTTAKAEELLQSVFPGRQTIKMDEIYEMFP